MSTSTVIVLVLLVVGFLVLVVGGAVLAAKQEERDKAVGVVAKYNDWRITLTHLIEGDTNDSPCYPLPGLEASFDMSGDISRDSGRYTLTRFALIGPAALAFKKNRNKKIDDREGYLTIVGPGVGLLKTVPGEGFKRAHEFVLAFNKQVWISQQHG